MTRHRIRCTKDTRSVSWTSALAAIGLVGLYLAFEILPVLIFGPE